MAEFNLKFSTVGEVYEANESVRARLLALVSELSEEQAALRTEKGDWTVAGIVEHLAMAEEGMAKVANHLLRKAAESGALSDGRAKISDALTAKLIEWRRIKGEAPEMVQPTGERTTAESIATMEENRRRIGDLREQFETVEGTVLTFPHPRFGPMTAQDWLALIGAHESRHADQIERILESGA